MHIPDAFAPQVPPQMTRPTIERIIGLPMDPEAAVDQLVASSLAGLTP